MYKRILVPIDIQEGERTRKMSLERAAELCRFYDAKLFALTVVPDMGMPIVADYFPSDAGDKIVADAENLLHELVDAHIPDDIDVQHLVAQGSIYRRILRMAEKVEADLIIMPAHRIKLQDYLLGTNTSKVVRHAKCSVLVLRSES
ncbi:universal stress protein [Desulfonatronum sp. SC1]|uniref:universal stress protein n=1 Tax=Desulfonatronum sp. SC1 TaxID=2109626 RepID=UPI000D30AE8A|nr:universal stress protein [Desulfonatronum sp. SC1]PTN33312.1 universal stress protein [Desulfonatronum sp. SC1]